ncbi:MAG TPA: ABC transporter substrate-binding protein [Pseudomonadales bacterium]|nr:ABC transporter substrate-binding protein [Pseudomonadales bacterium]
MAENGIKILSVGAPKTGVSKCAEAFSERTGTPVEVEFATAPVLKKTINSGACEADIVVAPVGAAEGFESAGHTVVGVGAVVGSVKAAVTVKNDAIEPDLSSGETLKQAILSAESVVYNEASSGQYIASMIEKMGITDKIAGKVLITKTGSAVMQHLDQSPLKNEIGFGQATEIQVQIDKGCDVKLLGTLPKEVEKISTYKTALLARAADNQTAKDLIDFMASAEGQSICKATGLI